MKESCVGAFARGARWFALAAVALFVSATTLHAQATGKLEGRVRDQAGAPIAGAQVRVEGTAFGAVADARGYYFINNVPAGSIDLIGQFVGYKPVRVTGLRILAGQTITQDFALEQQAVDIGEIEVTAAQNALVPRDAVTTKQVINGEYTDKLPVDRIGAVLALQPGVVLQNNNKDITIRGGRTDEAAVYIDGVPVNPGGRGGMFVGVTAGRAEVSKTSFEDASVTTGGSSAEYGDAQSGVIAIQTKSGGQKWAGSFGYENDEVGGLNHSRGFNRLGGGVGGPLMRNLSFYVSGDIEGAKSDFRGINSQQGTILIPAGVDTTVAVVTPVANEPGDTTYVDIDKFAVYTGTCEEFKNSTNAGIRNNYGFGCQGGRVPFTASTTYRVQSKLQYTFGAGNRVSITALRNNNQDRDFGYAQVTLPTNSFSNWQQNNVLTLNWAQNLSKSVDRALALDLYASYQWDRSLRGPLTTQSEQDSRDPFGGFLIKPFHFLFDFKSFPIEDIPAHFRTNTGIRTPYDLDQTSQYAVVDQYRNNPYSTVGFDESGGPVGRISLYKENRAIGKGTLDWQVDRYNRLKIGGEYTKYDMTSYSSNLTNLGFADSYHEKPSRWNAFLEDRLDLGNVVLVGGLRYDWYKTGASRPYYTDPTTGARSWFPRISSLRPVVTPAFLDSILVPDQSHHYLSPHIQVSFPVTERTNFRLSYAHQVQQPDFQLILGGINTDLSVTNTNHVYGTDLDFGRTITFEFGIRHAFSDDAVLDVSAYNKDKLSDAAGRLVSFFDPKGNKNQDLRVVTNADFGNARGVDIRFDRRIGELFNGSLAYTYEEAKNTGSDPFTYINFGSRILNALGGGNNPPPQAILTTNQNRPHNLAGQLALSFPDNWRQGSTAGSILENVGIFATFRFASGTAYTRCPIDIPADDNVFVGATQVCSRNIAGDYNGARLPSSKNFNLRVTKGFGIGGLDFTAYADARNLFNFSNVTNVFAQTNDTKNAGERKRINKQDLDSWANEATTNGVRLGDGSINLTFGSRGNSGCALWSTIDGKGGAPNCIYMIRAEQRYGNGDGIFTVAEQTRASDAFYFFNRRLASFTDAPRQVRLGFEVDF
jgi:outer membrane receptor for ferrienterochelin and colicin